MGYPNYKVRAVKYSGVEFPLGPDKPVEAKSLAGAMKIARGIMKKPSWTLHIGKVQVLRHRIEQGLHLYVLAGGAELTRRAPYGPSWDGKVTETKYPK
jgi:hypothetical protein